MKKKKKSDMFGLISKLFCHQIHQELILKTKYLCKM